MSDGAGFSELIPPALDGERIDRVVSLLADVSRNRAAAALAAGRVSVGDEVVYQRSRRVHEGDHLVVTGFERETEHVPGPEASVRFGVLYADDDVLVVVDEAYREFVTADLGDPITDLQPGHPNVVVLRTFSKAFGLAALRTGYAVADPEVVVELDKVLIAFAVNHLAQVASLAAIAARDEVQAVVDRITAERDRVVASLRADGWDLPDAHANFVYLPLGSRTDVVFPEMEKRGVVVRPFPGVGMRVTIGTPAQNDRFLATLAEVAAGS